MKALSDFIAVILFFGTYVLTKNMVAATAVAVAAGVIQAAYTYWKNKKLDPMQWIGLVLVVVFGGLTIALNDRMFIMLKTTLLTWLTAAVMLVSQLCGKNGLRLLLGKELTLPERVWSRLGYAWVVFFVLLGVLNLAVAYPFTPEREAVWFNFKMWVYLPLIFAFSIAQGIYLVRNLPKEKENVVHDSRH